MNSQLLILEYSLCGSPVDEDVSFFLVDTGTSWGSGGMRTKIVAAKIATATGIHTALCHGKHPEYDFSPERAKKFIQ